LSREWSRMAEIVGTVAFVERSGQDRLARERR
jgi:hypothetical protein